MVASATVAWAAYQHYCREAAEDARVRRIVREEVLRALEVREYCNQTLMQVRALQTARK